MIRISHLFFFLMSLLNKSLSPLCNTGSLIFPSEELSVMMFAPALTPTRVQIAALYFEIMYVIHNYVKKPKYFRFRIAVSFPFSQTYIVCAFMQHLSSSYTIILGSLVRDQHFPIYPVSQPNQVHEQTVLRSRP